MCQRPPCPLVSYKIKYKLQPENPTTPLFGRQRVLCFPSISPLFREADPAIPISFMDKVFNFFAAKGCT